MYDYKAKKANIAQMNGYMLAKTLSMFEYDKLPDSLPQVEIERMLQTTGYAFVTEVEGVLYAFTGGLGGVPDVYGQPTQIVISNPALGFNKTLSLKDDGVLFINDSLRIGLLPLFEKHNTLDQKIKNMEAHMEPGTPDELEVLKKKKLAIKDELYTLLQTVSLRHVEV